MINWLKVHDNYWILNYKDKAYKIESIEKLFVYSLAFGIEMDEIEYAVLEMNRQEHNFCEFGVWKTFIYSKRTNNDFTH